MFTEKQTQDLNAIERISKATQKGTIKWSIYSRRKLSISSSKNQIGQYSYTSVYRGKKLRIYRYNERYYIDDSAFVDEEYTQLEIIDDDGQVLYSFDSFKPTDDLMALAQASANELSDFFADDEDQKTQTIPDIDL